MRVNFTRERKTKWKKVMDVLIRRAYGVDTLIQHTHRAGGATAAGIVKSPRERKNIRVLIQCPIRSGEKPGAGIALYP